MAIAMARQDGNHANLAHISGAIFQKLMVDPQHGQFTEYT
jgi:hypothetical protein